LSRKRRGEIVNDIVLKLFILVVAKDAEAIYDDLSSLNYEKLFDDV